MVTGDEDGCACYTIFVNKVWLSEKTDHFLIECRQSDSIEYWRLSVDDLDIMLSITVPQ